MTALHRLALEDGRLWYLASHHPFFVTYLDIRHVQRMVLPKSNEHELSAKEADTYHEQPGRY